MTAERDAMTLNEVSYSALGAEERSDEAPSAGRARSAPDPEVVAKPKRRQFTAEYRLRILEEADRCHSPAMQFHHGPEGRRPQPKKTEVLRCEAWTRSRPNGEARPAPDRDLPPGGGAQSRWPFEGQHLPAAEGISAAWEANGLQALPASRAACGKLPHWLADRTRMDLIAVLKRFNRKERFHLLHHALGYEGESFRLGEKFRKALGANIDVRVPPDAIVMMDYHLDWISMAVWLAGRTKLPTKQVPVPNEGRVAGNQEDVDLLVAFRSKGTAHLVLVEAKGNTPGAIAN